ncbi:CRISPR-associated protein Cas5h [Clostridium cavendishii DSM 21758]|uniref:CRISPR-associated protein Cas5h n=1 Tax=Clostridium cavendishii DSM 21758 TaxID=1121302 RepID=A0A1M6VDP1_9CLOT|nr:type I-B CRISPR-associated protein Cas5b [Clostridium cavendishii]SHK79465.1 CRISPR-associated protein Cas5h [Clostridium cavendishii DSM 21758]
MKALKFNISGKTAFFKKPDVNTYYYFTYGSIHKVALLGIVGAILGLKGYNQQENNRYPEFYELLKDLDIAIVPKNEEGSISKKVQIFNNSVGYASEEKGGNLIVKEQWLENPRWVVYIKLDGYENNQIDDICKEIEERFLKRNFVYIPYLGKNDHIANIDNMSVVDMNTTKQEKINSLFFKDDFKISLEQDEDWDFDDTESLWKYEEKLPISLEERTNQYETRTMIATNMKLDINNDLNLYKDEENVLFFF